MHTARKLIQEACDRDRYSQQFSLIVIGETLPNHVEEQHSEVPWAKVDGEEAERLLDDAFAYLGSARLILRNPDIKLLQAVIVEIPKYLDQSKYHRVTTYFMGHGAQGEFYIQNESIAIVEVITEFNALTIQHFHYFDCCRVEEDFCEVNCLEGDAAVIYSTQPSQIAYTGEAIDIGKGLSDGVGVFTREFAILVKTHKGDFEQFARELGCQTKDKLEQLDSKLDTKCCRAIWHSTNVKEINFRRERENAGKIDIIHSFLMYMYVCNCVHLFRDVYTWHCFVDYAN